jgi:hypothetical protein
MQLARMSNGIQSKAWFEGSHPHTYWSLSLLAYYKSFRIHLIFTSIIGEKPFFCDWPGCEWKFRLKGGLPLFMFYKNHKTLTYLSITYRSMTYHSMTYRYFHLNSSDGPQESSSRERKVLFVRMARLP